MENQGEYMPTPPPSQPLSAYPPPLQPPPAYPPPYQQAYPQMPPPGYQQGYSPPIYPTMPPQGLPPSAYPLQTMAPRNGLATLSLIFGTLAVVADFGIYILYYTSLIKAATRQAAVIVYQQAAIYHIPVLLLAVAGLVCGITALTRAKNQGWNGLIVSIIGISVAIYAIFASLGVIIEFLTAAGALQSLSQ